MMAKDCVLCNEYFVSKLDMVLQRHLCPDEARFGVAASTTSTLLIVVGAHNIEL